MTYDVLVVDELEGESALLHKVWAGEDLRIVVAASLSDLQLILTGRSPAHTHPGPYSFRAALVDLDLGDKSSGPAGGVLAIHHLREWMGATEIEIPIVLRTGDFDDGRSMAAVLGAELLGGPLPWWGKTSNEARQILEFLQALGHDAHARPTSHGATLIQRVLVRQAESGPGRYLSQLLYEGSRPEVWKKIPEVGPETAHVYGGYPDRNEFWENLNDLVLAINYLRDTDQPLHALEGRDLRPGAIGNELLVLASAQVDEALEALTTDKVALSTSSKRKEALGKLRSRQAWFRTWLEDSDTRKPSQNNNLEQGEFLGAYAGVVCHPEVVDLLAARIRQAETGNSKSGK